MKNTTIILFGATGDLAKRKLIPALYRCVQKGQFDNMLLIGAASDDAQPHDMINAARPFIPDAQESDIKKLQQCSYYKKIDFTQASDFIQLKQYVEDCEKKHGIANGNRLFYLATAAHFFCPITEYVVDAGLMRRGKEKSESWHRIVYEKPFGHDAASAQAINECIKQSLDESQVYRIDHYLTKEIVSNIAMIRFTNVVFEPLWSNRYIDQVHIILSESIGIEGRGKYYDSFGAIRDVVQSHILELLALIAMETPEKLTGEYIRQQRAHVLERLRFDSGILGQYESYTAEKDVAHDSRTETYAALKLFVDNPRWTGVPFYVKTGKYLDKKETAIHIKFKTVDCL